MALIYAGSYGSGVRTFRRDDAGDLTQAHPTVDLVDPSFLAFHPSKAYLYAVLESTGEIAALKVAEDGSLTLLNVAKTGGEAPCHVAVDPTGTHAVVANYMSGSVSVHRIADGPVSEATDLVQHNGSGPNAERQEGPHAHMVSFTRYPQVLLVTDLGADEIVTYRLEPQGKLTQLAKATLTEGSGPRHMAHHKNGLMFVSDELDSYVDICELRASGTLVRSVQRHAVREGLLSHIEVTDTHAYVANRGPDNISVFGLDPWSWISDVPTGGAWPRHFAITGDFLYAANHHGGTIAVSELENGIPTGFRIVAQMPGASCVLPVKAA